MKIPYNYKEIYNEHNYFVLKKYSKKTSTIKIVQSLKDSFEAFSKTGYLELRTVFKKDTVYLIGKKTKNRVAKEHFGAIKTNFEIYEQKESK